MQVFGFMDELTAAAAVLEMDMDSENPALTTLETTYPSPRRAAGRKPKDEVSDVGKVARRTRAIFQ